MKLEELFENHNFRNGRVVKENLTRAYERIMDIVKTMGDRLDPKKASQVKSIQAKLKNMMHDPVADDQANKYAEQVHSFVQKLQGSMNSNQHRRDDNRNKINDKQAKRDMQDELNAR